ncbi:DEAD-box ATP-dependent RNA helicase 27 [Vitis vinifera]|uniref:ATP-dependent RNA helicase n=2 Tax=Vitis vinifera TaxID=29760 RepID=A0A438DCT2_VITVI|nr:DEAD-box ATP-dependent RNA helicase 27 [Vitis vinifera]
MKGIIEADGQEAPNVNKKRRMKALVGRESDCNYNMITRLEMYEVDNMKRLRSSPQRDLYSKAETAIYSRLNALEEVFIDEDLARLSFQTTPVYVNVDDGRTKVTNKGLQRGYCVVPSAKESVLLFSFLKKNLSKKVMVFFSSCNSVKCHSELLGHIQVDCLDIHGKQKQQKQTSTFFDFCKVEKGILLCTDVAAHGLDILDVDWMCQKVSKVKSGRGTHSCMACMVTSGPHATYCFITFDFENDFPNPIL